MSVTEENKALVRHMEEEIFNKRNLAAVDDFISPQYVLHAASEGPSPGRDAIRDSIARYLAGFPDLRISIDQILAEDDKVVGVFTFTGAHDGELFGLPPTGRRISVRQIAVYRIEEGKVVEEWEVSDQLGLMQQLGALPAPG